MDNFLRCSSPVDDDQLLLELDRLSRDDAIEVHAAARSADHFIAGPVPLHGVKTGARSAGGERLHGPARHVEDPQVHIAVLGLARTGTRCSRETARIAGVFCASSKSIPGALGGIWSSGLIVPGCMFTATPGANGSLLDFAPGSATRTGRSTAASMTRA